MLGTHILEYELVELLGEGGMGSVYRGVHTGLNQEVAIKVLAPELARDPDLQSRFLQEAEIQLWLAPPNVVRVLTASTKGHLALVMELVRGNSLAEVLHRRG